MRSIGLAWVTTKQIAQAAACSEGALYKHFSSKEELFIRVLEERLPSIDPLLAELTSDRDDRSITECLSAIAAQAARFYESTFAIGASLFAEPSLLRHHREAIRSLGTGPNRPVEAVADYLRTEQKSKRLRADADPQAAAALLMGACYHRAFFTRYFGKHGSGARRLRHRHRRHDRHRDRREAVTAEHRTSRPNDVKRPGFHGGSCAPRGGSDERGAVAVRTERHLGALRTARSSRPLRQGATNLSAGLSSSAYGPLGAGRAGANRDLWPAYPRRTPSRPTGASGTPAGGPPCGIKRGSWTSRRATTKCAKTAAFEDGPDGSRLRAIGRRDRRPARGRGRHDRCGARTPQSDAAEPRATRCAVHHPVHGWSRGRARRRRTGP